jgi:branched-subunit amino acid aminotransferase/4-amino-4-deoxychorismate lyase
MCPTIRSVSESFVNRPFLYGESLFTSFKTQNGTPQFLDSHFDRLEKAVEALFPFVVSDFKDLEAEISKSIDEKLEDYDQYFRITIWIESEEAGLLVNSGTLHYQILEKKLVSTTRPVSLTYSNITKAHNERSPYLKLGSYANAIMDLRSAKLSGFDDVIYLDCDTNILEASTSNVFYIKEDVFYTPPISGNVLAGITRLKLIECLKDAGRKVFENTISKNDLEEADAIFLTNAVRGITAVEKLNDVSFNTEAVNEIRMLFDEFTKEKN